MFTTCAPGERSRIAATGVTEPRTAPTAEVVLARRRGVIREIAARRLLTDAEPMCAVIDLDTINDLVAALQDAFPAEIPVLHTIAAKSIALRPILRHFAGLGIGCEVASPGELHLALEAGFSPERIIYDSPAKTVSDLAQAIRLGVTFNIDNFEELERVDSLIRDIDGPLPIIGVRINPQSGSGAIAEMSTGTPTSKFGIGLRDAGVRDRLIAAFVDRPWLRQLHTHSGSQGVALEHSARDVGEVVRLAEDIERAAGEQRVRVIDVGGGLSVNFESDVTTPVFADHVTALRQAAPLLFTGKYGIATEFGRSLTAKAGVLVGRVEYVKVTGERAIAVTPIGVQVATRTVFMPQAWALRIEVFDSNGVLRTEAACAYDVAGPACFAGDVIATERWLPEIHSGDIIAVPDTGGYYASSHFGYNSLLRPAVYAVASTSTSTSTSTDTAGRRVLHLVRRAQTLDELAAESGEPALGAVN